MYIACQGWKTKVASAPCHSLTPLTSITAIQAVQSMVGAADFDRKMLLLATQLANESEMKTLLLSVLETLLATVQSQPDKEIQVEGLTLIRCIIRLVVRLMGEPAADRYAVSMIALCLVMTLCSCVKLSFGPNFIGTFRHRYAVLRALYCLPASD